MKTNPIIAITSLLILTLFLIDVDVYAHRPPAPPENPEHSQNDYAKQHWQPQRSSNPNADTAHQPANEPPASTTDTPTTPNHRRQSQSPTPNQAPQPSNATALPEIQNLNNNDTLFQQISEDIQAYYRWQAGNGELPALKIYNYRIQEDDSLFSLSARLNLSQSSIASLNRLLNPQLPPAGIPIYIPNLAGIYSPQPEPTSPNENQANTLNPASTEAQPAPRTPTRPQTITFTFPGTTERWQLNVADDYNNAERLAFLNRSLFQNPLPEAAGRITSTYGIRRSPFTGRQQFHYGLDIAAPSGTPIYTILEGTVTQVGEDATYGRYLRIDHPAGYESLYAHLSTILVDHGQSLRAGQEIGKLGNTGLSTGPHLHLEIFQNGTNRDPQNYIWK